MIRGGGQGQSVMKLMQCSGLPEIYDQFEGVHLPHELTLTWVYVHSAIYDSRLVYWFSRDLCLIGGGGGSVCHETYVV